MGLKVRGLQSTLSTFRTIDRRSTAAARKEIEKGAYAIRDLAREYSPVDEGNLEKSIRVKKGEGDGASNFSRKVVMGGTFGGVNVSRYAAYMHEGSNYNLGPKSLQKADATGKDVGRKFLFRAFTELRADITKRVREALRRSIG